jgi:hypothetical protein
MKDYLGNKLYVGDRVIFIQAGEYPGLGKGVVSHLTEKNVMVYDHTYREQYEYATPRPASKVIRYESL